jgi:DnaK suppressor protein
MTLPEELIARIKEKLEAQRREAEAELRRLQEFMQGEVDVDAEEGDPDLFERALKAIEAGVYGICERCRQPIDPERLEARPEAVLCIACQQEVERLARRNLTPPPTRW